MSEEIDIVGAVSSEFGIARDEHEHGPKRAATLFFSAIIWQAYLDLTTSPDPAEVWDAQHYFHNDIFEDHATQIDLDPDAARHRLIKEGKLPDTMPAANPFIDSAAG